jgi:prophage regulatory protein
MFGISEPRNLNPPIQIAWFNRIDCKVSLENSVRSDMGYISASPLVDLPILPLRFLRFPAVRARTGLSRSTIWRLEREGCFPPHRRISRNAAAWVEDEVIAWMRSKVDATTGPCEQSLR